MKKRILIWFCACLLRITANAQFVSVSPLQPVPIACDTKNKPQSRVWMHDGKFWTVFVTDNGTFVCRLENGTTWVNTLKLSNATYGRPDCKVVGDITHILLFRGTVSHLFSIQFNHGQGNYQPWSVMPERVKVTLDNYTESASLEVDPTGRMWIASDAKNAVNVRWSDAPYTTWSNPVMLVSGINSDDVCGIIHLPALGKLGVFWSNQRNKRFGFRTHADGTSPTAWTPDEVPGSQSAQDVGKGMADDHLHMAVSSNGTLYAAIKTSYNNSNYPQLGLLVRRPSGTWDDMYEVSRSGTRPRIFLNEHYGKLKVVYTSSESGGNILYKETHLDKIAFGSQYTLISGTYNFISGMKENYSTQVVILASNPQQAVGVLATDGPFSETKQEITETKPEPEKQWILFIYPNPFSASATIKFAVPEGGDYVLSLNDFYGNRQVILSQGYAAPGESHSLQVDATSLKPALYFLTLQTKTMVRTLKVIVSK